MTPRRAIALEGRVLAFVVVVGIPSLVAIAAGADEVQTSLVLGASAGVVGRMLGGRQVGLAAIGFAASLSLVAAIVSTSPPAVGVVFAAAGVVVGMAARSGAAAAMAIAPIVAGFAVDPTTAVGAAVVDAVLVAIGGGWAFVVVDRLVRSELLPSMPRQRPLDRGDGLVYAAALGIGAGVGNGIVAALEVPYGSWLNLTLFIVAVPSVRDTVRRIAERSAGTVVGAALTIAVARVLPWPDVWHVLAVLLIGPMVIALRSRYWVYTVFLTMVVVFTESESADTLVEADAYRLGLTLATSAAVLVIALLLHAAVATPRARRAT